VVRSGVYHETVALESTKANIYLHSEPGGSVWLDGSEEVSGFVQVNNGWEVPNWQTKFDASPTYTWGAPDGAAPYWQFVNPDAPMAAHPDQVWINGKPLRQVASLTEVEPGTFAVDYATNRLRIGDDPTAATVSAATLAKALSIRAPGAKIDGINVRRYAPSVPHMGAVTLEADAIQFSNSRIQETATTGMHIKSDDVTVRDVAYVDNGMMGLGVHRADRLTLTNIRATSNNVEQFNTSPAAGGVKLTASTEVTITNSQFLNNHGTGLWFDESCYRVLVTRSRSIGNTRHGVSLETSGSIIAAGNVVADNGDTGFKVNDADHVQLWNNTLVDNPRAAWIVQDSRDLNQSGTYRNWSLPITFVTRPVRVRNNLIVAPANSTNCQVCAYDSSGRWSARDLRITSDGNLYQRAVAVNPSPLFRWGTSPGQETLFWTAEDLRGETGHESRGRLVRPRDEIGPIVSANWRPSPLATARQRRVAVAIPTRIAKLLGVADHVRHLGAP
jgi:hypothetical protein